MALTRTFNADASGNEVISGTVVANAGSGTFTVSGTVTANAGSGTMAVSGPLTDTQLRATPIQVTAATSSSAAMSSVAGSASSASLLASNSSRKGICLFNDSTAICRVAFGATASATAFTVLLQPNSFYENGTLYTGAISGIWASATGNMRITELT